MLDWVSALACGQVSGGDRAALRLSQTKAMAHLRDMHALAHTHSGWGWEKSKAPFPPLGGGLTT